MFLAGTGELEFIPSKKGFKDAQQYCLNRNKVLAFPENEDEQELMSTIATRSVSFFWIDATDEASEGLS